MAPRAAVPVTRLWHVLHLRVPDEERELAVAALSEFPLNGIEEDPEDLGHLAAVAAAPWDLPRVEDACAEVGISRVRLTFEELPDDDWLALWKRDWTPTPLGKRLVAVPAWWDGALPAGRLPVRIDPGRAFGTGTHATTALAWQLVEEVLERHPSWMLDVGTGSGLLALGALTLAPDLLAVGTELDPDALPSIRANLEINPASSRFLPVQATHIPARPASCPLVVANMTHAELMAVEADLVRALAPGGHLVAGGYLAEQVAEGTSRWNALGLKRIQAPSRDGWTTLLLKLNS